MKIIVIGATGTIGQAVARSLSGSHDVVRVSRTSGVLSKHPIPGSASVSLVNAGVEAFARAAALELPRDVRVNVVSPPWVQETLEAMGRDPAPGLPASTVARAYVASVEGAMSGEVLDARAYA